MEKFKVDSENDIATEKYQGPGAFVTGAGYVYIFHWAAAAASAIALGAVGYLAAGKTVAIKEAFTEFGLKHSNSPNIIKKAAGVIVGAIPKAAEVMGNKIVGAAKKVGSGKLVGKPASEDKATAVIFAGGIGGISGFLGSTAWGFTKGHHQGNKGKRQFQRAQAEIGDLRERNDDLEKINDKLHEEVVEANTKWKAATKDSASTSSAAAADASPDIAALQDAQHHGTLQAQPELTAAH